VNQEGNPKAARNEHGRYERNGRRADLSFDKCAGQAEVVASGPVAMEELMERVTDREGQRNHQQDRQNAAECRFRQMAGLGKCESRLHDNTRNQAHTPFRRKLDLRQCVMPQ